MEYKVVNLCEAGNHYYGNFSELQKEFDNGWEYVDSIQQFGYEWSPVGVVLRKSNNLKL